MIHPKRRDGCDNRFLDDIRRVIFATMVSLKDGGVDTFSNKGVEGYKGE